MPRTPTSTRILQKISTAAQRALRRVRRHAAKEREAFLHELKARIALRMSSRATDTDAAIKNIERQLSDGRRFRLISRAIKPSTSAALTKVEIVTSESHLHPSTGQVVTKTTTELIDTRKALEAAIIKRNRRHFAQADGTPFTREPLSRIGRENNYSVYHDANGHAIQVPEDSFPETKVVVALLKERHRSQPPGWSPLVSFDQFISGLLHWREKTSTSPSGRHLGLIGALVTAHCNSSGEFSDYSDECDATTQDMAGQILTMIHGLAATVAKHGFYLHRWIRVVNVMIYQNRNVLNWKNYKLFISLRRTLT
jgi:hypothetical protein